jgi:hypothetical protein
VRPFLRAACAALIASLAGTAHAQEIPIGIGEFIPGSTDAASVHAATTIGGTLRHDLFQAIERAAAERDCTLALYAIDPESEAASQTEKALTDSGLADPATGPNVQPLPAHLVVHGAVGMSSGEIDYVVTVLAPDGSELAAIEGSHPGDDPFGASEKLARQIVDRLCPHRFWHLRAEYDDLLLDSDICDITKPFAAEARGATEGLVFSFTPTIAGGAFTVGGSAGGVPWSGGGSYNLEVSSEDDHGRMPITGQWQITTMVGVFGDSGTISAELRKLPDCSG